MPQFRNETRRCSPLGFFFVNSSSRETVLRSRCLMISALFFASGEVLKKNNGRRTNANPRRNLFISASFRNYLLGRTQQRLSLFNTVISKLPVGLEQVHAPGMDVFSITLQVELERLFLPSTKKV